MFGNIRKKLLVDSKFQKQFILFSLFSGLIVSVVYFIAIEFFYLKFVNNGTELGLANNHIYFQFIEEQKIFLNTLILTTTIVTSFVMVILGLYYSNRISGPLFRLQVYLQSIRNGQEIGPLSFRENDYFNSVAEEINLTLVSLKKAVSKNE